MPIHKQPDQCLRSRCFPGVHVIPSREQSEALRPAPPLQTSILLLAWLLGVMVLAGPSGCGPSPPGDPANSDLHASTAGPSPAPQAPLLDSTPATQVTNPRSLASHLAPAVHDEARPAEPLVVPVWIATALKSPDVQVRLQALDRFHQTSSRIFDVPCHASCSDYYKCSRSQETPANFGLNSSVMDIKSIPRAPCPSST